MKKESARFQPIDADFAEKQGASEEDWEDNGLTPHYDRGGHAQRSIFHDPRSNGHSKHIISTNDTPDTHDTNEER